MTQGQDKLGVINGLRGVAILGVIHHHYFRNYTPPGLWAVEWGPLRVSPMAYFSNGWLGVNLFFILSGLVLFLPYCQGRRSLETRAELWEYYRRRWARLMPFYYLSLLVAVAFFRPPVAVDPVAMLTDALIMATATFNLFDYLYYPPWNWVLWSLGIEIWFSVLFPALVVAVRRWGIARLVVATIVFSLVIRFVGVVLEPNPTGYPYRNYIKDSLAGRLDDFVLGMAIAHAYVHRARVGQAVARALVVVGAVLIWIACVLWDSAYLGTLARGYTPFINWVMDAGAVALTYGMLCLDGGVVKRLFSTAALQIPGMMCYSLYVWHGIVLQKVVGSTKNFDPLHLATALALTALLSLVTYRYVEFGRVREGRSLFRTAP